MLKKIISIFFISLFVIQLLPLKEVGKWIAGATMTEEIPETGSAKATTGKAEAKWLMNADNFNYNLLNSNNQYFYIHFSETLPSLFSRDVQTPPPDFVC